MPALAEFPRDARWDARPSDRGDRVCYALAFVVTWVWFAYYQRQPGFLCDEGDHVGNVIHFLGGQPGWPEAMTMLPGYHFLVAALWKTHPPISLLTLARLVSTVTACLGLIAFASASRRLHTRPGEETLVGPGRAALLIALMPVLYPFTGMAYTDAPALAFVLAAFAAQVSGRFAFAALFFVIATAMRQTNLTWAGFAIGWEWLQRTRAPAVPGFFRRTIWLWLLLAAGAICVLLAGRISVGTQTGTALQPNIAALHLGALLVLLLGLPVWIAVVPRTLREYLAAVQSRPALMIAATAIAGVSVVLLARGYANPHVWNRELRWDGVSFTLLRNWPLVWIDKHQWLRLASGATIVLMLVALVLVFARQRKRRELWLALGIGALFPAANNLIEPRYYIPGIVMVFLLLEFDRPAWRWLLGWWALLCAVHAPFVQRGLSLW